MEVLGAEHLPRGGNQADVLSRRFTNQLIGFLGGSGNRFVEVDVLTGADRRQSLLVMEPDRGAERDQIDGGICEQVIIAFISARDAEFAGGSVGASGNGVTDGGERDTILHIFQAEVLQCASNADTACSDDADAEGCCH